MSKISRRAFVKKVASSAVAGIWGNQPFKLSGKTKINPGKKSQGPNIILFLADDMRWDAMGVAGNQIIQTPNLDKLAADGCFFENNFVTTSICCTSRASILTGQYARQHQVWDFATPLTAHQFSNSYPAMLQRAGYRTAFVGKWGLGGPLPKEGFDHWRGFGGQGYYFGPKGNRQEHLTDILSKQAEEFLKTVDSKKPFCLTLSTKAPHVQDGDPDPFKPDPKFAQLYNDVEIPRPPTATEDHFEQLPAFLQDSEGRKRWKQRFATDELFQHSVKQYYRLIAGIDETVGEIIACLKKMRLYSDTYLIFTSDNGFFLGEHGLAGKWWGYEESIRTPLIIKPIEKSKVQHISSMTLNIDLCPTLCEIANLPIPNSVRGISLIPNITNRFVNGRSEWFYEHMFEHPNIAKSEGIRTERFKYLKYLDQQERSEFLFDLYDDPFEENNLVGQTEFENSVRFYRKRIQQLQDELNVPEKSIRQ